MTLDSLVQQGYTEATFAGGKPYIKQVDFGKYSGGEWHLICDGEIKKSVGYTDKESRQVKFRIIQFWGDTLYGITEWEKTPFGTYIGR